jgi:4-hydroxybenzoate polyprenyltransferase
VPLKSNTSLEFKYFIDTVDVLILTPSTANSSITIHPWTFQSKHNLRHSSMNITTLHQDPGTPKTPAQSRGLKFHIKTIYLFICNYNVIVVVWALLGTTISMRSTHHSDILYSFQTTSKSKLIKTFGSINHDRSDLAIDFHWVDVLTGFSLSLVWVTIVALGFSISNQRRPSSVQEDTLNKPWRPLPSQRITPSQASALLVVTSLIGLSYSTVFGGLGPYLVQLAASYHYNDLGGAQSHHVVRDILNAIGVTSWLYGCIDVAGGSDFHFSTSELYTSMTIVAATTTTIAIQDFRDLEGDRACGRATFPIVLGHGVARATLAASVLLWSFGITVMSRSGLISGLTGLGTLIAVRLLLLRNCSADKVTMELWYGWFATVALALL